MRKLLEEEERMLVWKVKSLVNPETCDTISSEREGKIVTIAYYQANYPKFDIVRFKNEHIDLYKEYLIIPKPEDKNLFISKAALRPPKK